MLFYPDPCPIKLQLPQVVYLQQETSDYLPSSLSRDLHTMDSQEGGTTMSTLNDISSPFRSHSLYFLSLLLSHRSATVNKRRNDQRK